MAAFYARRCGEDADDLLQEAWVGLLEALPELDIRIGRPEQYLIQRARWRLLDSIKHARVRRCSPLDEIADFITSPDAETNVDTACVSEFVGQLKSQHQAVLNCLLNGLTWREAGETLGCSSANIAYHVRQIRRRFQEWTDEEILGGI
jgi:RNA polymerase sigma-70 factor (ECF subfamily)